MQLYTSLDQTTANKIAQQLGFQLVFEPSAADILLIFPGYQGSIIPGKTIAVAGVYSEKSREWANQIKEMGVLPEKIYIFPDTNMRVEDLKLIMPQPITVPQVIGIISTKGGVGKTTIATSLVAHYNTFSQKAVVVDACKPFNAHYHLQNAGEVIKGMVAINDLKDKYDRIVIDLPHFSTDYEIFDLVVAVVDSDLVQCIRPTQDIPYNVVIYNRVREELPIEIVRKALDCPVIAMNEDHMGCAAALTGGRVASSCSEIVATAIGQLAAELDQIGQEMVKC